MKTTAPDLPVGTLVRLHSDLGNDGRICIIFGVAHGPGKPLFKLGELVNRRGPFRGRLKVRGLDHHVSRRTFEVLQTPTNLAP